jgi:hypothetical protein
MANEFIIRNGFQSRGNGQITGSLSVTGGITGSYTGSFTGDGSGLTGLVSSSYADNALSAINTPNAIITASNTGNDDTIEFLKGGGGAFSVTVNNVVSSSYAVTASYALNSPAGTDTNLANTNLSLTGTRFHDLNGFDLTIAGGNAGIYLDETTNTSQVGQGSNYIQVDNTATSIKGNTIITGSLKVTNVTQNASINNIALYDTVTDQFYYTSSAGLVAGTDTNFANTNLTFDANRYHDSNGFDFYVTADSGGFASAYLGYNFTSFMGTSTTSSYIGVGSTYVETRDQIGFQSINFFAENTSSMTIYGGVAGGVDINNNSLFVSTVTDNVSIGKNTSNAKLDVNGNTIITGSLTVTGLTEETGSNAVAMYDSASGQLYYASTYQGNIGNTTVGGGTTTETGITAVSAANRTIPANSVKPGDMFNIKAYGTLEGKSSNCDIRLRIGGALGVLILSGSNLNPNGQHDWKIDADMIIRSTGASGQIYSAGLFSANEGGLPILNQFITTQSLAQNIQTIDTTTDTEIDLTVQFVGSVFDNITTEMFKMTKLH